MFSPLMKGYKKTEVTYKNFKSVRVYNFYLVIVCKLSLSVVHEKILSCKGTHIDRFEISRWPTISDPNTAIIVPGDDKYAVQ